MSDSSEWWKEHGDLLLRRESKQAIDAYGKSLLLDQDGLNKCKLLLNISLAKFVGCDWQGNYDRER